MTILQIILIAISVLMLIEGLIIALFPKSSSKIVKHIFKNPKNTIKIGLIEIIISLIILLILIL